MKYYTTTEAAKLLGITDRQIRRYCVSGKLGMKIGRNWAISPDEVEAFVRAPMGRRTKE